jgi:hypothetical protein
MRYGSRWIVGIRPKSWSAMFVPRTQRQRFFYEHHSSLFALISTF